MFSRIYLKIAKPWIMKYETSQFHDHIYELWSDEVIIGLLVISYSFMLSIQPLCFANDFALYVCFQNQRDMKLDYKCTTIWRQLIKSCKESDYLQ